MDRRQEIEDALDQAILDSIEQINKLPAGSPERLKASVEVATLYKSRDQQYRAESEYHATIDAKEWEMKAKDNELVALKHENRKNRIVQVATTAGTLGFWALMFSKTLEFEETGTATSSVFKTLYKGIKLF